MSKQDVVDLCYSDEEQAPAVPWREVASETMPFGKFKGKLFKTIISTKEGRDYFRWALKTLELRPLTKARMICGLEWYNTKKNTRPKRRIIQSSKQKKAGKKKRKVAFVDDEAEEASTEEIFPPSASSYKTVVEETDDEDADDS